MEIRSAIGHLAAIESKISTMVYDGAMFVPTESLDALRIAQDVLKKLIPGEDTGVLPCGCGEKAERLKLGYQRAVACKSGHVFTGWKDTQKQADDAWNKGMGFTE